MSQDSQHQLAAILFSDIVDYSALMQRNRSEAIAMVAAHMEVLNDRVTHYKGKVLNDYGDGSLCIFPSATDALRCAMDMQIKFREHPHVPLRIGIHIGDILFKGDKPFGDGVNIASRIESLGQAGTVFFSKNVYDQVKNLSEFEITRVGDFTFKNIDEAMSVYALSNEGFPVPDEKDVSGKLSPEHRANAKAVQHKKLIKLVGGLLFILALTCFFWWYNAYRVPQLISNSHSIAVLPFDNYADIEDQSYFAEAISDEIRSQLSSINDLKVISGYSSKYYKGQGLSSAEIGKELGVSYILGGTVQRLENTVKVGIELSNSQSGELVWSPAPFERDLDNIFDLENEISQQIVKQLRVRLTSAEQKAFVAAPTSNPEAYQLFLRAQELMDRNRTNVAELNQAIELLKQATALDPTFDRAHLALAESYMDFCLWGRIPPKEGVELALNAIFKVKNIESAEYQGILGSINFNRREIDLARELLEKSLAINSNYLLAQVRLAWIYNTEGRNNEALELIDAAISNDPLDPVYYGYKGFLHYYNRQYEQGLDDIREGLKLYPEDNFLKWTHGFMLSGLGRYTDALEVLESRTVARQTNWMIGYCYSRLGKQEKAREILNYHLERRSNGHVPAHMIAAQYVGLEDYEEAINWLEVDVNEGGHEHFYWGMKMDIKYDPLRENPRFQQLMVRVYGEEDVEG